MLNLRVGRWLLYPLRLLSTWAHECAHGLAALLVGGRVERLLIFADGSGLAITRTPATRLRQAAVASAGYTGTAALGALLLATRHWPQAGEILVALGALVLLSALLWVRNLFGIAALALSGGGLIAAGLEMPAELASLALALVGAAVSLNALSSLRHLYGRGAGMVGGRPMPSDASAVAALLWLPAWVWSTLWLVGSLALVGLALRYPLPPMG